MHALHAEHDAAQGAYAQIQIQLVEAQAQRDDALQQQSMQSRQQCQNSNSGRCSSSENVGKVPQTKLQTQEGDVRTAVVWQNSKALGDASDKSVAADHQCSPQASA